MCRKINRSRLLVASEPSSSRCRTATSQLGVPQTRVARVSRIVEGQVPAEVLFDWICATRDLKALEKIRAALTFAKLVARVVPELAAQLYDRLPKVSPELLRTARVRLDAASMLANRDYLCKLSQEGSPLSIHLFADASPLPMGNRALRC